MKYLTTQRKQLYEFLKANPHKYFTAKQIEQALNAAGTEISISAIYRNLAVLKQMEFIKTSVDQTTKETRYRFIHSADCQDEIHITCARCGKIFHMEHTLTSYLRQQLLTQHGFELAAGKTVISGICSSCRQKETAASDSTHSF